MPSTAHTPGESVIPKVHVYPLDDLQPHARLGVGCACRPRLEQYPHCDLVIHQSYDGRELWEAPEREWQ